MNDQKILDVKKADQLPLEDKLHLTCMIGQKVLNIEKAK